MRSRRDPVRTPPGGTLPGDALPGEVLPGGGVEIRPARMDDEERIRRFLGGLSVHTQTLRFFTGMGRPAASTVRALLAVDDRRDALLAVCGDAVVGHAMSFRTCGSGRGAGGAEAARTETSRTETSRTETSRTEAAGAEAAAVEIAVVEIAVVVADDWQGRGLGSRLVRRLVRRATAGGAQALRMDVLGGNRKVLSMIRREWPEAVMRASSGTVEISTKIGSA
ncbi:hypothetical protein Pve01_33860 [Planomonospora venezuelensis]|nr:hypothetical protein Pve01_33860 [Planomonospora venezuelensis]